VSNYRAAAVATANIALIKYWGNRDDNLRLPTNGSISMNLDGLFTRTQVTFDPIFERDTLVLNKKEVFGKRLERVSAFLNLVRELADQKYQASVISENNFPIGAGIASSAAAFAALSLAATRAIGLELPETALSQLARRGSGSACRSIPGGFVEWNAGIDDSDSYAHSIAPATHWDLADCIAIVSMGHKSISSTEGHSLASTSPLQAERVKDTPRRLELCRQAILNRDFQALTEIVELDSHWMHAVMMTSHPRLLYWAPATLRVMQAVHGWRNKNLPACYTIDAGPNVHVLCPGGVAPQVAEKLSHVPGVIRVLTAQPGGPAQLVNP
jgi:diphosphomevalonate decarboxylase